MSEIQHVTNSRTKHVAESVTESITKILPSYYQDITKLFPSMYQSS